MLKKNTVKRTKVCAQSPVNALSNRNHHLNEAPNNSILSQYHSTPIEYTLDLRTNFKPPTKLTVKKTPECQISLANAKENLASTETQNENNHLSLVLRKPGMKAESKSPLNLKYSSSKSRSALENSAIKKEECQEDEEITQKMLDIQNELNKLSLYEPRSPTSLTKQGQNAKFVEIVGRLKEIITQLQGKDRLQRKEIAILKKNNEDLKKDLAKFEQNSNDTEKIKEITALFPTKYGSYPTKEKRNSRTEKQRLEEKAHAYAKSALSSPAHKTFDLHDRKKKFLGNELSRERSSKDEKLNSVNLSYSVNNETLVAKTHQTSISNLHLPNQSRSNNLFYTSTPAQETTQKDLASNQITELDSLVQLRVVTMSDIENSDEGTCSSHKATSHQNITSLQDIYNTRDTRMFPPTEQFQSLTQREHLKSTREQVVSHRLNLSHQNSPNSSSIISFPNTSFVPSKARRDEIRDKSHEKDGARSHSQPINERHNGNVPTAKETSNLDGNLSPTASEVMIRYKQYLNEPHVSPLQCESKSINKDFGWHYLTTVSKNGEDTKNLSINTINNFTRNEIKLPTLTDELSKIIIPEELASEELKRENSYDDKVTLFNRCLKLTMGLGSSVLDENQPIKNINQKNLISMENIVLSPNLSNIKGPFCLGIAARK